MHFWPPKFPKVAIFAPPILKIARLTPQVLVPLQNHDPF